ncbi:YeeE/YedE thiosulfate transporter family protein [Pseudoxanthomonas dokdonensis]|uniref:Uncharacterized protein n=1 Tax=Pseudoxanthomonas dokdonensis TaxID=344882 RepID=A0A0R0CTG3_9GAMM|nr:YeeE/YedE thiosulfate transporter family protein [Pseudoxanthomonas dokdonensis]KRG68152.1 hypothetical protein ABB29_13980 [Pseudoxanthomonas dokdonensis]
MDLMTPWLWIVLPGLILGWAVQRGPLCAVKASAEIVHHGRWRRFWAIWQCPAWAWALTGLATIVSAHAITLIGPAHHGWQWPLLGGMVFATGAWINGGCSFGTVARLGRGEISFALTLLAMLAGQLCALRWLQPLAPISLQSDDLPALHWRWLWHLALAILLLVSLRQAVRQRIWRWQVWRQPNWPPALAMPFVAAAASVVLLIHQHWPSTSIAAQALSGHPQDLHRWGLLPAVVVGTVAAAMASGSFRPRIGNPAALPRRLGGGLMMGVGSVLIPGGNGHLLVAGIPALQVSALLGYLSMLAWLLLLALVRKHWIAWRIATAKKLPPPRT